MRETEWTGELLAHAQSVGAVYLAVVGSEMQQPGWPDRYLSHVLWHGWVEFKGQRTVIEPLQVKRMKELNMRRPGSAWVVRHGPSPLCALVQTPDGETRATCIANTYRQLLALVIVRIYELSHGVIDVDKSREAMWKVINGTS